MKIVTASAMRELDRQTIDGGFVSGAVLMERAGKACAEEILEFSESLKNKDFQCFVILCGKGNNGGDGYVIAKELAERTDKPISVLSLFPVSDFSEDAAFHFNQMPKSVELVKSWDFTRGDLVVDCLLGTGVKGDVREPYLSVIQDLAKVYLPTVAIDICSGVNGDDGTVVNTAVSADLTVCIGLAKCGNVFGRGGELSGVLKCVDIGFPQTLQKEIKANGELFLESDKFALTRRPNTNGHKYNRGTVFVVGGSDCYSGAPLLAVEAAMRAGAGMAKVLVPSFSGELFRHNLAPVQIPYITQKGHLDERALPLFNEHWKKGSSLVIGPGMKGNSSEKALFAELIKFEAPLVIDAGALNFVSSEFKDEISSHQQAVVLTPHEGELKRLMKSVMEHERIDDASVKALSKNLNCIIVKKGRFSRVISPCGKISINSSGSVALATAGTGDLLAGMIGAKLSDFELDAFDAVCLVVFEHGELAPAFLGSGQQYIADDFLHSI